MSQGGNLVTAYVKGNIDDRRPKDDLPEDLVVSDSSKKYLVSSPHGFPHVTTTSADEAYDQVLANAGANVPYRDAVDQRLVEEVKSRSGVIIDAPGESTCVGLCPSHHVVLTSQDYTKFAITDPLDADGWPILAPGTPPVDSDHDGMPDDWETARGLNPNQDDSAGDRDGDGYTNVEEYINGLVTTVTLPDDTPPPPVKNFRVIK